MASSSDIGGRVVGMRFASVVFPAPGGPINNNVVPARAGQARKTLVANKIVLKSKELTSIARTCLMLRDFHEVSRAGGPK
jgi:hypothetical protein